MSITSYFPFSQLRPYQKEVMDSIEKNWDNYNYFFLEAPVGFGKSPIAYAVAKWLLETQHKFTHIIVNDIYLQSQYLRDFHDIKMIKGRNNYECSVLKESASGYYTDQEIEEGVYPSCGDAPCVRNMKYQCPYKPSRVSMSNPDIDGSTETYDDYGVKFVWNCEQPFCRYLVDKNLAVHTPITIHNYSYFLYEMMFGKGFTQRELGVFDEAHTIETTLMSFIEMNITEWALNRITGFLGLSQIRIPTYAPQDIDGWKNWLDSTYYKINDKASVYGDLEDMEAEDIEPSLVKSKMLTDNFLEKLGILISNMEQEPENWVWTLNTGNGRDSVHFKPVNIAKFAEGNLLRYANKHILMSATILDPDKLKKYLGIEEEVKFLRVHNSNFPVQNRPLYIRTQGKATAKTMEQYLPRMLNYMDLELLPNLIKNKGVIHSHTNDIARYILANSKFKDIMISNVDNTEDKRDVVFQYFFDSKPPSIMVTPSMRLGIDLHDDLARWQIISKIPYPYLGDPQVKKRTEIDAGWYEYQTLTSLVQTYGRVCRSETDFGETYVLDGKFDDIVYRNMSTLPQWFREAIKRF
jgi:ATP-dependent DNA helicase DinG